jgi:predicted kinase
VTGFPVTIADMETHSRRCRPMLTILSGLPGVGKTAIGRELARQLGAVYVRIDSIEQAMRDSRKFEGSLDDAGYRVGYAIAEDNLRLGLQVVADSVNPLALTRDAWVAVAARAGARAVEIELTCSDAGEHRRRAETRSSDIAGLRLPQWDEIASREYHAWTRDHVAVDTAGRSVEECVEVLKKQILLLDERDSVESARVGIFEKVRIGGAGPRPAAASQAAPAHDKIEAPHGEGISSEPAPLSNRGEFEKTNST